jgi:hypothetical protein
MLFKTPTATLIALAVATVAALITFRARITSIRADAWPAVCLGVPIVLYSAFALTSHLNIGVRHMLPIYPFLFLIVGRFASHAATTLASSRRKLVYALGAVLACGLLAETLGAYPNFIPFFNLPSGGARGGLRLLSDSNLDWGQDLPLLAEWQSRHPNERLYLCYFGSVDPPFYGIRYLNLPNGHSIDRPAHLPTAPGVIAISASKLQGMYVDPDVRPFYDGLRARPPREVLGGSIYLYDYPGPSPPVR